MVFPHQKNIFFCWSTRTSSPSFKLETKHVWNHNLEEIRWSPLEMYRYTLFIYDVFSTNLGWFPKFWEPSTVSTANLIWDLPKFQMVFARNSPLRMISELRVDHTPPRIHVMMVYLYAYVFGVSASRSATLSYFFWLHMGWGGVGLCSRSFNLHTLVMHTPWMLRYSWGGVGWGCVQVPSTCTSWWCTRHECYATHGVVWVGLCSRSFNLHTLVMHTPWMLRYSWGGVGWGCVHVPSTCTRWWCTRHECYATHGVVWGEAVFTFLQLARWWCTRHECYATHGVVWGGAVFTFLQLAHAGDAHAMNATLLMGWCGVGLCSRSFNLHTLVMHTPWMLRYSWGGVGWGCVQVPSTCTRWWCTRHECYATHGVVWGGAVFMFLQLAHAGDAHAMNATVLMGWCGVAVFMFLQVAHAGHGVGVGVGVGGVMLLTFNWSRTPTWCYAQLLHLHKRCHVGVERFWGMPLGGFGRLLTVNMIGCNRPRSAGLLWRFHAWLHWLGCQLVWRKYRVHIYIYIYKFANVHIRLCMYIHIFPNMHI